MRSTGRSVRGTLRGNAASSRRVARNQAIRYYFPMDLTSSRGSAEQVALDALSLPAAARAELAHRLLLSLDEAHDDDAEALVLREVRRRSDEVERGAVRPVPMDEAVGRLRAGLVGGAPGLRR